MAAPNHEQLEGLGPPIPPFARSETKTIASLQEGSEDILYGVANGVYDATNNNYPKDLVTISTEELELLQDPAIEIIEKKYLWVIQEDGIKIIKESTLNPKRSPTKKYVCHTNLTGAGEALQGGELYFCDDGAVYLNNKSDRYGCYREGQDKNVQRNMVLTYFRTVYRKVFYLN